MGSYTSMEFSFNEIVGQTGVPPSAEVLLPLTVLLLLLLLFGPGAIAGGDP